MSNIVTVTSDRFCALDADITFESCDHVLFKVHRKNLEVTSEGFSPPSGTIATHEVIPLIERAEVLDLLFQYMYPQRLPDLASVPFAILADLAEAAEKYQLYVAMKFCNMLMKPAYKDHPFEVLIYATRHGYADLMDVAQVRALELSPAAAFNSFPPAVYIAWTRYYAQWMEILEFLYDVLMASPGPCRYHSTPVSKVYSIMRTRPAALLDLDALLNPLQGGCEDYHSPCPPSKKDEIRKSVQTKLASLKSFGSFL